MAPPSGDCAVCGQTATLQCARCTEGLDISGKPSPTYYYGKPCQKIDWSKHKPMCDLANARKQLYRSGLLLKQVVYAFREAAFDFPINSVQVRDGKLHLSEPFFDWNTGPLFQFPNELFSDQKDKNAVLTYNACSDAMAYMGEVTKKVLEGICDSVDRIREMMHGVKRDRRYIIRKLADGRVDPTNYQHEILVVHLVDGVKYAIDIAGAQFCQHTAVLSLQRYMEDSMAKKGKSHVFGYQAKNLYKNLVRPVGLLGLAGGPDYRVGRVQKEIIECMNKAVQDWEAENDKSVKMMLNENESKYKADNATLLAKLSKSMQDYIQSWESQGKPDPQSLKYWETDEQDDKDCESLTDEDEDEYEYDDEDDLDEDVVREMLEQLGFGGANIICL